jgi:tellurite methyltransferase
MMVAMDARDRWNARYAERPDMGAPATFVCDLAALLAPAATVVDLAGGTGRHAVWLASLGHTVPLVDISSVALQTAAQAAREAGIELETIERDLEADGLPPGRSWDLVLMHYYFDAAVVRAAWRAVRPGGLLAVAQPTITNLERHDRPGRRFLLEVGQLEALAQALAATSRLEVLTCSEAWRDSARHEGRLVVRRAAGSDADRPGPTWEQRGSGRPGFLG